MMIASTIRDRHGAGKNIMARIARETAVALDIKRLLIREKRGRNV